MKVLVFGASGKTGGLVIERALAAGHEVTVVARDANKVQREGVRALTGDATNPADVLTAVQGQDAVIDTIGGTNPYKITSLESTAVSNMIDAMKHAGVRRLIVVSMMGLGESRAQAPFWYKYLLMPSFLNGSTKDKRRMEGLVTASGLEYVIARPPILKDGPATGRFKIISEGEMGHSITRADLAGFLVDQLASDEYLGRAVTVVNAS
jgi:putative NADH-flavin reductase